MKVIINKYQDDGDGDSQMSGEEFADLYNLTMVVNDRGPGYTVNRYYAAFDNVAVKEGNFLVSKFGEGRTPEDAISKYWKRISGSKIVVSTLFYRRELCVPKLGKNK